MTEENKKSTVTVEDVQNLIKKKDEIEEQIKAYYDVLEDVSWLKSVHHLCVFILLVRLSDVTPASYQAWLTTTTLPTRFHVLACVTIMCFMCCRFQGVGNSIRHLLRIFHNNYSI